LPAPAFPISAALAQIAAQKASAGALSPFADPKFNHYVESYDKQLILLARFLPLFARIGPWICP
jgi:hypothetical protein